jgi:MFS family permease
MRTNTNLFGNPRISVPNKSADPDVIARFVIGLGLGASSMSVPPYLAEMSPKEKRGRLVSMFLITVGILCAYGVGYAFASSHGWRWMLGLAAVPALLMFAGLLTVPESPRWLLSAGREEEARGVLERTRPADEVDDELTEIKETMEAESTRSSTTRPRSFTKPALAQARRFSARLAWGTMNVLLTLTVLTLINTITTGMFWLYGAFALVGFFYLRRFLPETKGRSLEEIDQELQEQAQVV